MTEFKSSNFEFLSDIAPPLLHQAALAERYCFDDPNAALVKLLFFCELLVKKIANKLGIPIDSVSPQVGNTERLVYRYVLD